jgi:alpha-L-fucosidase 2
MHLTHDRAADHWSEATPIGNGTLGGLVYGGAYRERVSLNHDRLWAGGPKDRVNPGALAALPELRRRIFAGNLDSAAELCGATQIGVPPTIDCYEPLGELIWEMPWRGATTDYRRWLDHEAGEARAAFRTGRITHERTSFASFPDRVLVLHHTCDPVWGLWGKLRVSRARDAQWRAEGERLILDGKTPAGLAFAVRVQLMLHGPHASQAPEEDRIRLANAQGFTAFVTAGVGADCVAAAERDLAAAVAKGYDAVRRDHQADYQALYRRTTFSLAAPAAPAQTVEAAQQTLRDGRSDPQFTLRAAINHRAYLQICSSRPGSLPSTLQGIWNEDFHAPWNSDFHTNINLQMNYWPAERLGLGETVMPLVDWLESIRPVGEDVARRQYGCRGWVLHHLSDPWGTCTPCDHLLGMWPMGAAWMCQHLWWRYEFGGDRAYLRDRAWPLIAGAARFLLDFLVEAPAGTVCPGKLVTNPSHSPENAFRLADGRESFLTYAATMDIAIIRDLLRIVLLAGPLVNDASLEAEARTALARLPGYAISPTTGGLMEWIEDHVECDPGHRHMSHLFPVHPGVDISPRTTPELAEAAKRSLERRVAHRDPHSTDHDTGWALGWLACLWANLGDGDRALAAVERCLAHRSTPNLMTDAHGAPQVGDMHGITEAICEMLVQDRDGVVRLLPALPSAWPEGSVTGLRLRGGHQLDLAWSGGKLTRATITGGWAGSVTLAASAGATRTLPLASGASISAL